MRCFENIYVHTSLYNIQLLTIPIYIYIYGLKFHTNCLTKKENVFIKHSYKV